MKHIFLITCLLLVSYLAKSQSGCNCAYTVTRAGIYDNSTLKVKPGQTVCIQAGRYDNLRFNNFTGTTAQPIRFVNCGGQVLIGLNGSTSALQFQNSSFFVVSGSGDTNVPYGFLMNKDNTSSSSGIVVGGFSSDYEVDHVEVAQSAYTGFFFKLDPGCDSTTWRGNYTIKNVKIHDNFIHDINSVGMFLGSGYSSTNGTTVTCNGTSRTVYSVEMTNLQVYNNVINRTAGSGIQVNNAPSASVYDNTLTNTSLGPKPTGLVTGGSAACGCDYTITRADTYNNAWFGVEPGKTVCIQAGQYNYLRINNFVGASGRPIRFINCGGQVTAGSSSGPSGITFSNSRYFALSGSGDPNTFYGINLTQSNTGAGNSMGVSVGALSSDCEIDHIEVGAAGFAGIMVKTDPSCDSTTWRENFTMYDVRIHDNYIHDTAGEGLYIGNSFYGTGMGVTCNGTQKQVYPHVIYGLVIYNNRTLRTGCEGIQYACAPDAQVYNNVVQTTGTSPFAANQDNGLQISGGAGGDCYNNTITDVPGTGIAVLGHLGNSRIFNNVISQVGVDGIFCDDRPGTVSGASMQFINNTINGCGRDGIRLYNEINVNTVANNVITGYSTRATYYGYAGRPMVFEQGATATRAGNFTALSSQTAGYNDVSGNDYTLVATSPLIRAGVDASNWRVAVDRLGNPRPTGRPYTIGAYEYVASSGARQAASQIEELGSAWSPETLTLYPSPFTDQLTFQMPVDEAVQQLTILSVTGQVIGQWTPGVDGQRTMTIETDDWQNGLYIYQVYSSRGVTVGRVLKE